MVGKRLRYKDLLVVGTTPMAARHRKGRRTIDEAHAAVHPMALRDR